MIESWAYYLPEESFSTNDYESQLSPLYENLKLSLGRIELMTGVRERKHFPIDMPPSSIAAQAARLALSKSQITKDKIDLIIHASVCRNFLEPATASVVHKELDLNSNCEFFDLSNACLGVLSAMSLAKSLIENENNRYHNILIVSGENGRSLIENTLKELKSKINDRHFTKKELKKYIANFTIGSAGVAVIMSKEKSMYSITGESFLCDTSANHLCTGGGDLHSLTMETDSEELLLRGNQLAQANFINFLSKTDTTRDDYSLFLLHQVGIAHEFQLLKSLEIDQKKTFATYPFLGNTGSAALPITWMMAMEQMPEQFQATDNIALLGIGSGLSSLMFKINRIPSL